MTQGDEVAVKQVVDEALRSGRIDGGDLKRLSPFADAGKALLPETCSASVIAYKHRNPSLHALRCVMILWGCPDRLRPG